MEEEANTSASVPIDDCSHNVQSTAGKTDWNESGEPSLLGHLSLLKEQDCLRAGEGLTKNAYTSSQATTFVAEKRVSHAAEMHQLQQQIQRQGHDLTSLTQRLEHATLTMKQQLDVQETLREEVASESRKCLHQEATIQRSEKQTAELTERLSEAEILRSSLASHLQSSVSFQEKLENDLYVKAEQREAHLLVETTEARERVSLMQAELKQKLHSESQQLHAAMDRIRCLQEQCDLHEEARGQVSSVTERRLLESELSAVHEAAVERRRAEQLGERIEAMEAMRQTDLVKAHDITFFQAELAEGFLNLQESMRQRLLSSEQQSMELAMENSQKKMRFESLEEQVTSQLTVAQSKIDGLKEELQSSKEKESDLAKMVDTQQEKIRRHGSVEERLRSELQQSQRDKEQAQDNFKAYVEFKRNNRGCLRWGKEPPIPGYTQIN
eukprot:gnl/MRDRNA2_/MRDRNA2_102081_c0_seq1.p1 gnl/MRDRNA2_/MRDRNA2_102081_c0~~gnl/MRDRNA2_/MRDRNA2_102081_c0_seq1.p1  ORF type:complete len:440 (+),score=124.09 gnl/MRDRNA2_/MRDRNA2_102081_c0_seq1:71-1390(+)